MKGESSLEAIQGITEQRVNLPRPARARHCVRGSTRVAYVFERMAVNNEWVCMKPCIGQLIQLTDRAICGERRLNH